MIGWPMARAYLDARAEWSLWKAAHCTTTKIERGYLNRTCVRCIADADEVHAAFQRGIGDRIVELGGALSLQRGVELCE